MIYKQASRFVGFFIVVATSTTWVGWAATDDNSIPAATQPARKSVDKAKEQELLQDLTSEDPAVVNGAIAVSKDLITKNKHTAFQAFALVIFPELIKQHKYRPADEIAKFAICEVPSEGGAAEQHENIMNSFTAINRTPESSQYATFLRTWVQNGNTLDLCLDLHNVESAESCHLFCAMIPKGAAQVLANHINSALRLEFVGSPYRVSSDKPWFVGSMNGRLQALLTSKYETPALAYELNSQDPKRHLSLPELVGLGGSIIKVVGNTLSSETNTTIENAHELQKYYENSKDTPGLDPLAFGQQSFKETVPDPSRAINAH